MSKQIEGIFFDLGNTFRVVKEIPEHYNAARRRITELVGTDIAPDDFYDLIMKRYDTYREWALSTNREAYEDYMWTRWLTPDYPRERIEANAGELTYLLRQAKGRRDVVEGGAEVVKELFARGYTLGIISDLIGVREVDEWLDADGLRPYFKAVMQSSVSGIRKPDPIIFWAANGQAGVMPERSVFIGDNMVRDIAGAKKARYGMTIAAITPDKYEALEVTEEIRPDAFIFGFGELLQIFPRCPEVDLSGARIK